VAGEKSPILHEMKTVSWLKDEFSAFYSGRETGSYCRSAILQEDEALLVV